MTDETSFSVASLQNTFQASASDKGFQAFLDRLAAADFDAISIEDRCKAYQHINNNVIDTAQRLGLYDKAPGGGLGAVTETHFLREIALMLMLAETLNYSSNLDRWLEERTSDVAANMHAIEPAHRLERNWKTYNLAAKFGTAIELVEMQLKTFEKGAIDFLMPQVRPLADNGIVAGSVQPDRLRLDTDRLPIIALNVAMVARLPPAFTLKTAFHETVHMALWQLGAAAHRGVMPKDHPLYADAVLSRARIHFKAISPSSIPTVYNNDPEELRCYKHEEQFWNNYQERGAKTAGTSLRSRLAGWIKGMTPS